MDELDRELLALRRAILKRARSKDALEDLEIESRPPERVYADATRAVRRYRERMTGRDSTKIWSEIAAAAADGAPSRPLSRQSNVPGMPGITRSFRRWRSVLLIILLLLALAVGIWLFADVEALLSAFDPGFPQ